MSTNSVPEDPQRPGFDVLGVGLRRRGHYVHEAMASADGPMTLTQISKQSKSLAQSHGYECKANTFSAQSTRSHLVWIRDQPGSGFAEQLSDGRWQLTDRARQRIADVTSSHRNGVASALPPSSPQADVRTVDAKSRLLLPKEFANATVTIERVSPTEIRIQKAIVIPESSLPLLEDSLKPLSDRDRDFFLNLLDNPPEPTPAFLAAAARYKKRHG